MYIVSKFQFFIRISAMVKLKKKNQKFERGGDGEKWRVFATFSKCGISVNY